jgi:NAD(P)-dependent dehydrogenase (short-subunit alcohol dehydrogenase family)
MSGRLAGQAAWVSGGASGIGAAVVRRFAAEGAAVAFVDIQQEPGRRLEAEVASSGGSALFLPCDVASEEQVARSIEQTARWAEGLSILVNAAGVVDVRPLEATTGEQWDRLMAVNVKGVVFSVKHALPHFRKLDRSHVVNIGSISSLVGQAGTPAYTASKAAVLGLSRSIALDYAAIGLRCNCVCPGITDTPMLRRHLAAGGDARGVLGKRLRRVPLGRVLHPDEVARAVLYLACEDSAGVTGTSLVVDAGYTAAAEWDRADITLPDDLP